MEEQAVTKGKIDRLIGRFLGGDSVTMALRGAALILVGLVCSTLGEFFDSASANSFFHTLGKVCYAPGSMFIVVGLLIAALKEQHVPWVKVALIFSTMLFLAFTILGGMV